MGRPYEPVDETERLNAYPGRSRESIISVSPPSDLSVTGFSLSESGSRPRGRAWESSMSAERVRFEPLTSFRIWAIKFIEQWLANPDNKDKPNPLAQMDAILTRDIQFDTANYSVRFSAYIGELGLWAVGDYRGDASTAPRRGDTIKVKFDSVRLGTTPELRVTPC